MHLIIKPELIILKLKKLKYTSSEKKIEVYNCGHKSIVKS